MTALRAKRSVPSQRPGGGPPRGLRGYIFRREGEYWTIVYDGTLFRLRDAKGLQYLARLLCHPGEKIHSTDLFSVASGGRREAASSAERARLAVTKRIRASMTKIAALHPTLADHLTTCIRTGYFCVYACGPERPISWKS